MTNPHHPPIRILDGGMSRELMRLNAPFRQPEWTALPLQEIHSHYFIHQVHEAFALAGADILTTNSYAIVPFHIGEACFWKRGRELAASSGRIARTAASNETERTRIKRRIGPDQKGRLGREVCVAGSLPPVFGSYQPALFDGTKVQSYLAVLVEGLSPYVDVWLGETLSLIAEAEAVKVAVKRTGKPFWVSFTLDDVLDDKASMAGKARLRSGESVTEAAQWALRSGAAALLFNCSRPEVMSTAVREARALFEEHGSVVPIGVYANAFETESHDGDAANAKISAVREDLSVERYAQFASQWVDDGASIVGGCCGIGKDHIKRLAELFKGDNQERESIEGARGS